MESFLTIKKKGTSLFKDGGSKHFGFAYPCNSKEELETILSKLQAEHSKANHICYAYRIYDKDIEQILVHSTDDNEPRNSAGPPILGQIESAELLNCAVFVVRYFGGKKLGVSGLINAYKTAASDALSDADIKRDTIKDKLQVTIPFANYHNVIAILKKFDIPSSEVSHTNTGTHLSIEIPRIQKKHITEVLFDSGAVIQS